MCLDKKSHLSNEMYFFTPLYISQPKQTPDFFPGSSHWLQRCWEDFLWSNAFKWHVILSAWKLKAGGSLQWTWDEGRFVHMSMSDPLREVVSVLLDGEKIKHCTIRKNSAVTNHNYIHYDESSLLIPSLPCKRINASMLIQIRQSTILHLHAKLPTIS